jgi:hypothetical protein
MFTLNIIRESTVTLTAERKWQINKTFKLPNFITFSLLLTFPPLSYQPVPSFAIRLLKQTSACNSRENNITLTAELQNGM